MTLPIMLQTETQDVLRNAAFHAHSWGRTPTVAEPGNVQILAEDLETTEGRDCFPLAVFDGKLTIGPGIVHNTFVPGQTLVLTTAVKVFVKINVNWVTDEWYSFGTPFAYRLPGPQTVAAELLIQNVGQSDPFFDDTPERLQTWRLLALVRRPETEAEQASASDGWWIEPGEDQTNGIFPICISPT